MLENIFYLPENLDVPPIKINEFVRIYNIMYPNFNINKFNDCLIKFELDNEKNCKKKITDFSNGQQKKIMIAVGLACQTRILLMDEPTNGLDIPSKTIFRQLIAEAIDENKIFIISTHQVRDLENIIDPVIIIEKNQVLLNNSISEITQKLLFVQQSEVSENTIYSEQTIGGYLCVNNNLNGEESKINIEILFNAVMKNKEFFKQNFLK